MDTKKIEKEISAPGQAASKWIQWNAMRLRPGAMTDMTKIPPVILTGLGLGMWIASGDKAVDRIYWDRCPGHDRYHHEMLEKPLNALLFDADGYLRSKEGYMTRTLGMYYPPIDHISSPVRTKKKTFWLFGAKVSWAESDEMAPNGKRRKSRKLFVYLEKAPDKDFWHPGGRF